MSRERLTLKERVEKIENTIKRLGLDVSVENLDKTIHKAIKTELEKAEVELNEVKEKLSRQIGNIPEILDELCQALEGQTDINLILLRKKIREL